MVIEYGWFDLFFTAVVSFCDRLGQMDFNACHPIGAHVVIGVTRQVGAKPNDAIERGQRRQDRKFVICSGVFFIFYVEL